MISDFTTQLSSFIEELKKDVKKDEQDTESSLENFKKANPIESGSTFDEHKINMEKLFKKRNLLRKAKKLRKKLRDFTDE